MNRVTISSDNGLSPTRRQTPSKPMLGYCHLDAYEQTSVKFGLKKIIRENASEKNRLPNGGHIVQGQMS